MDYQRVHSISTGSQGMESGMTSYSDNMKFDDIYDEDIPITPFIKFWHTINDILIKRGQPEILYGEAQYWFDEMNFFGKE